MICKCKKEIEYKPCGSVGTDSKNTGWHWYPSADGNAFWLCPECKDKAKKLMREFHEIVKDKYIRVWQFLE